MPWARLDDRINLNAKILALSDPAHRMFTSGLAYVAFNLTDGFIPTHAIHSFGVRARNKEAVASELCAPQIAGKKPLWTQVDGGYRVNDYLDWNDSKDQVIAERAKAKERLDRHRGKKRFPRVVNAALNTICNAVTDALQTTHETPTEQVSTYHVPHQYEKQERAEAPAHAVDPERINRLETRIRQHRRRRSRETDDGRPAESVIAALARDVLTQHPDETDDGELRELLKQACARANLKHDGQSVGNALEVAKAQVRKAVG